MRARIDVSEIEAQTKIRAKYLRALENEEWDLLPGPTFVRSFLRTYAQALGLDAKLLVDEYRLNYEQPSEPDHQPLMSSPRRSPTRPTPGRGRPPRGYAIAMGVFGLLIVLLIVGLLSGKGKPTETKTSSTGNNATARRRRHRASEVNQTRSGTTRVALSLKPTAPVYVCLIDATGRKRIPGLTIEPPYKALTYHSAHFQLLLGNNAVTIYVDGKALSVPPSSKPIAYSITSSGRHTLAPNLQPTCG